MSDTFDEDRERMVAAQLAARGIADGRVLEAMRRVGCNKVPARGTSR